MARGGRGVASEEPVGPKIWKLRRYDFTIQFYWTPTPRTARLAPSASGDGEAGDTAALSDMMGPTGSAGALGKEFASEKRSTKLGHDELGQDHGSIA
jgi:hypothetical protein